MKSKDKQFSLGDLLDIALILGGFGFVLSVLIMLVPPKGALLLASLIGVAGLGLGRILTRRKQKKINTLEEQIIAHQIPELLEKPISTKHTQKQILQNSATDDIEIRFLEALIQQNGRITLTEAVVLLRVAVDKLLPVIERLQHKGIIGAEVSDSGQIIYVNMA